jgi:hypothetical protein
MSAIWPLQVAIWNAILADATIAGKLKGQKIYSLRSPESDVATLPHLVLGQSVETPERTFEGRGNRNVEDIHIWSGDLSKFEVVDLAADLERILDQVDLTLEGHVFCTGSLSTLMVMLDPSGKYSHAVCRYEALSYVAA